MRGFEFFVQTYSPSPPNLVHLTKDGQVAFGKAMANQYLEHLAAKEERAENEAAAEAVARAQALLSAPEEDADSGTEAA